MDPTFSQEPRELLVNQKQIKPSKNFSQLESAQSLIGLGRSTSHFDACQRIMSIISGEILHHSEPLQHPAFSKNMSKQTIANQDHLEIQSVETDPQVILECQLYRDLCLRKEMARCRISTYLQNQCKNTISNIENSNEEFNSRLGITEERISQKNEKYI